MWLERSISTSQTYNNVKVSGIVTSTHLFNWESLPEISYVLDEGTALFSVFAKY